MDKDDEFLCTVCKKKETDGSKVLTCLYCFSSAHFKCKNVVGNAIRRMRETDYYCSSECSAIYQRIITMQNNNNSLISSFAAEMKATISASVAKEMQAVYAEVKQITASIENSQEFLSSKFDEIVTDFKDLKLENEKLKIEIDRLKSSHSKLQSTVYKLEANVDKSDRAALGNNAVLWGIPTASGENVSQLVEKCFSCLGLNESFKFVTSTERMFTNVNNSNAMIPIRVVFCDKASKDVVLNRKKQFGKLLSSTIDEKFNVNGRTINVTLRDELSPLSLELLKELRESQELLNLKYIWAGKGGVILAKKDDDSKPDIVKNREDLSRIKGKFLKTVQMDESGNASGHSPSPKRKKNAR